jgi:hypothetical protein
MLLRDETYHDFRGEARNLKWVSASSRGLALHIESDPCECPPECGVNPRAKVFRGTYYSQPSATEFEFQELVPSWNISLDEETQGYRIHVRVWDAAGKRSPWFYLGAGGILANKTPRGKTLASPDWGTVDVDHILLRRAATRYQYKVDLASRGTRPPTGNRRPVLQRFFVACRQTSGKDDPAPYYSGRPPLAAANWVTTLSIPYRSQLWVPDPKMRGEICCPTCVSMVMESLGVNLPTEEVARQAFDSEYKIYGSWPRASQAASRHGLEAWVERFRDHEDVKRMVAAGMPVVASIRAKKGELRNATYPKSDGHLILLRGFTAHGDYIVNDPYSPGPGGAEIVYSSEDIQKVWLDRGGVGVMIRKQKQQQKGGR